MEKKKEEKTKGFIYIMTNPALHDMVKIGYSADVERRRKELSTTALPYDYEIYATYEVEGKLEDKKLHNMIDKLNPELRVSANREFYVMSPEDAYELLEAIKYIGGSSNKLCRYGEKEEPAENHEIKVKKPPINFKKCGIPVGAELVFAENPDVKVIVSGERKVTYGGIETSLSTFVQEYKGLGHRPQGTLYFTYNGRPLLDIANETQWKIEK